MRAGIAWSTTLVCLALSGCEGREPPQERDAAAKAAALARGRSLYLEHCALCHGDRGDGQGPRRGSLARPPADFRSPLWRSRRDRARVREAIREGVAGTDMPPWQRLGERAVDDLTSYVLSLGAPPAPDRAAGGGTE